LATIITIATKPTSTPTTLSELVKVLEPNVENNLDFLLSHFEQPVMWPRNIAVYLTGKTRVYSVANKAEAVARFKQANLLDCRISAYPSPHDQNELPSLPPTFVFADQDESTFKTHRAYNMSVNKTRKNFKEILDGNPTILGTGNGVHFYQPVKLFHDNVSVLEDIDIFAEFKDPTGIKKDLTTRLMRHIEAQCTGNKHDPGHRPSVSSCLVRVPHTLNSKCVDTQTGEFIKDPEVKILQRWDGQRAAVNYILQSFRTSLINGVIKKKLEARQHGPKTNNYHNHKHHINHGEHHYYYTYIERLLQTPIKDSRKRSVSLLIIPYLVVIKKLRSDQEVFNLTRTWLDKCAQAEALDRGYDYSYRIRSSIRSSRKGQIPPMRLQKLKEENRQLHDILSQ
jgi:Primase X